MSRVRLPFHLALQEFRKVTVAQEFSEFDGTGFVAVSAVWFQNRIDQNTGDFDASVGCRIASPAPSQCRAQ